MKKILVVLSILGTLAGFSSFAKADTYEFDPAHSSVSFRIRHIVSKVPGEFRDFSGTVELDEKSPEKSTAKVAVKTASFNTNNEKRDTHVRSADFLDVEKYPEMTFTSKSVKPLGHGRYSVQGDLSLHGVTKPLTLTVEYMGTANDPWGGHRAGFVATGKLNRKDYGMTWNKTLDKGNLLLGDEVEITFNVEAVKKAPAAQKN